MPGFKCYFPAADHDPQHFEVYRRGEYVVRIFCLRTNRKRGLSREYKLRMRGGIFHPAQQDAIDQQVMKRKRKLLRDWNAKVCPDRRT